MTNIVQTFPDDLRPRYQTACDNFRIPYWDSAQLKTRGGRTSLNVPYLCTLPTVEVYTPTGTTTIDNPLYSFKFPNGSSGITSFQDQDGNFFPFATVKGTSRYPPQYSFVDNDAITEALRNLSSLGEDVYRSFTTNNYTWYSSTQQSNPPAPDSYQSLEAIHNEIHGLTGGGGHMSWNTVAAFDPIFWLHHCNVDRLFAIWQAVYPTAWFDQSQLRDQRGTWSTPAGTRETPQTQLTPFHMDARGTVFTSNDARDWTKFGSSYPELQPWLPKYQTNGQFNNAAYRNDIVQQVTNLYARVRGRIQRTQVPQNRLFAAAQSGPQHQIGGGPAANVFAAVPPTQQFAPPPQPQFAPPSTGTPAGAPVHGLSFAPPPTQGQASSQTPAQNLQFAPPPTHAQSATTSPPAAQVPQFAPPPTQPISSPPPTFAQSENHPGQQQHTPQPGPQAHQPAGPKPSGLRGLMSSAQQHLNEAITAGRDAATHGNQPPQHQAGTHPAGQPPASGASALASKFGGIVGGGIHMAQQRLGSKKNPQGGPGGQNRGIDDEDEPGEEGGSLSRGFDNMSLQAGGSSQAGGAPLTYHEYDCNIRFERFDLGGRPFTVHIFLGDFNPNPATWMWDKNRVGGVYNFVAGVERGDGSACSNCEQQSQDHTVVTGQVSLTNSILDDVEDPANHLNSLIPEEVIPYLQQNLHWRITDAHGRDIPREQLRSLKISVTECSATLPTQPGEFIHYGTPRVLDIVTEGRPCGKAAADGY
ncbi:Tyrosinase [Orbilia brochopaga]|nr:Tyrosinase [Drechslerella brochopaga]